MNRTVFVARQPIFDRKREVFAYELLFRDGPEAFADLRTETDQDRASAEVLDRSLNLFGLGRLTRGRKAFFNVTQRLLLDDVLNVLPPDKMVVEILESVHPEPEVVAACRRLRDDGYVLALDDFRYRPELEPLVELADIVKVDFRAMDGDERRETTRQLAGRVPHLLAEKVESREEFDEADGEGYTYFQGYFFCFPETLPSAEVPGFKLNYLRLLRELNKPDLDFRRLEEVLRQEPSLSLKLLRFINSAHFALRSEVSSLGHALAILGEREIRRWATLVILGGLGEDKPPELMVTALVRARLSELLGLEAMLDERDGDPFLMGMLSVIDALVDVRRARVLDEIGVAPGIRNALLESPSPLGRLHSLVRAWERADWEQVSKLAGRLRIIEERIPPAYRDAVEWAHGVCEPSVEDEDAA